MKKIIITTGMLLALPFYSYAVEAPTSTPEIKTSSSTEEGAPLKAFTLCSQDAIEKRDTSIAMSRSDYNIAMNAALLERKNTEKLAITNDGETSKKNALKLSVENYKNKAKAAQNNLTQARKLAWQTFETDIKKCREDKKEEITSFKESSGFSTEKSQKSTDEQEYKEVKTIKETFRSQLETLKSLFN